MLDTIKKVKDLLDKEFPGVPSDANDYSITAAPSSDTGFPVRLTVDPKDLAIMADYVSTHGHVDPDTFPFAVHYDPWHPNHWSEGYCSEEEAVEWFFYGLSNRCRLKYVRTGGCRWRKATVEYLDEGEWKPGAGWRRPFRFPWKDWQVEYKQNTLVIGKAQLAALLDAIK